jgi:hypothetical protein
MSILEVVSHCLLRKFQGKSIKALSWLQSYPHLLQEASDRIIEVYDDSPVHFEIMLKYLYDLGWTYTSDGDKLEKSILDPIRVYALADKYDIPGLRARSAQIFPQIGHSEYTTGTYEKMIEAHYDQCAEVNSEMGCKIAALLLSTSRHKGSSTRGFMKSESFSVLTKKYPIFAADLILLCRKNDGRLF